MKRSDLESLGLEQLRAHRGEKWQRYPADVLPAWVAELDFPVAKPIQAVLETALQNHDFGYPLEAAKTGLPEAFCERMERRFRWSPDPGLVEVLSDVVQGVYIAIDTLSEPGDAVAIHTPIYPPFLWSLRDTGRRLASNPLVDSGTRYELDLAGLRAAPVEPRILLLEFADSSVNFEVSVWIDDPWSMQRRRDRLNDAIWWALKQAGITIAFPQLDLHLDPQVVEAIGSGPRAVNGER